MSEISLPSDHESRRDPVYAEHRLTKLEVMLEHARDDLKLIISELKKFSTDAAKGSIDSAKLHEAHALILDRLGKVERYQEYCEKELSKLRTRDADETKDRERLLRALKWGVGLVTTIGAAVIIAALSKVLVP